MNDIEEENDDEDDEGKNENNMNNARRVRFKDDTIPEAARSPNKISRPQE